ncbi:Gfo/Idh/MocA family oxidoreductase [soil metagenome]
MTQQIRFALIGAGGIAQSYGQAFLGHADAKLVAVADVRVEAATKLADTAGCPAFATPQELIEGPDFDAVIVSTPPNTHEQLATYFLNNGKHVLCEKPFTVNAESAHRMIAVARKENRVLTMASKFRYVPDVIKAKSLLEDGLIGETVLFENAFTSRVDMRNRWNSDPAISGGGVLIDNGAHSLDLTRFFLGPLSEVHAVEGRRFQQIDVEDTVQVFVHTVKGVLGTIDLSWSINKERETYIELHGLRGTIRLGWKKSTYKLSGSNDWIQFGSGYDKVTAFRDNLGNFARHLLGREPLVIGHDDALANVAAIDAAYQSMNRSQWSRLAESRLVEEVAV